MDGRYSTPGIRRLHPLPLSVVEFAHRRIPGYFFRHYPNKRKKHFIRRRSKTRYTTTIDLTDANLLLRDLMQRQRDYIRLLEHDQKRLLKKLFVDQQEFIDT
jgi:hypothetical protein